MAHLNEVPIWMAALIASRCRATAHDGDHAVQWRETSGRASYTNTEEDMEIIQPLGGSLHRGDTVAVSWLPGETGFRIEVCA